MLKYIYYRFCPINEKRKRSKKIDPNYDRMFFGVVLVALTPLMVFIFKITENLSHAKAISAIVYLIIVFIVERAIKEDMGSYTPPPLLQKLDRIPLIWFKVAFPVLSVLYLFLSFILVDKCLPDYFDGMLARWFSGRF